MVNQPEKLHKNRTRLGGRTMAIGKQAQTLLIPVSARRKLNDLSDDLWTKISIEFYKDGADAVFEALDE